MAVRIESSFTSAKVMLVKRDSIYKRDSLSKQLLFNINTEVISLLPLFACRVGCHDTQIHSLNYRVDTEPLNTLLPTQVAEEFVHHLPGSPCDMGKDIPYKKAIVMDNQFVFMIDQLGFNRSSDCMDVDTSIELLNWFILGLNNKYTSITGEL